MNNVLISIIIPVYNVESYIAECLDSVFEQDLSPSEYEVICVNDGSTDNSRRIIESYLQNHANLIVIDHPCNLKLGSARNTGISIAKGKYIWHVDSDDFIAPFCLKEIVKICQERHVDILEFGYIGAADEPISNNEPLRTSEIVNGQEYIKRYFLSNFGAICPIWRRVYRREFLLSNEILSPPINMGEDSPYAIQVFVLAKYVSYEHKNWYYHRINTNSLVGSSKQNWTAQKWYEASIECARFLDNTYQKVSIYVEPDIKKAIINMIKYFILYWDNFDNLMDSETKFEFWRICRSNCWQNRFVIRYLNRHTLPMYFYNMYYKWTH